MKSSNVERENKKGKKKMDGIWKLENENENEKLRQKIYELCINSYISSSYPA